MASCHGMVMEIKGKHCIVLTNDGRFVKVPLPREGTDIGREINVRSLSLTSFKPLLAVASLLVAAFAWIVFQMMTPAAVAYVAIDINPSIELGVDKKQIIISAKGLNEDGRLLLQNINLNKLPLEEGLKKIIDQAIKSHYLSPEKDNLVLTTVTKSDQPWSGKANISIDQVYDTMRQPINTSGIDADLVVSETKPKVLKEAQKAGTTPGRYLIQQEAAKKGITINNQELRERKIREIETSKHIKASEYIRNANPDAIFGKSSQPYAELTVKKNTSHSQGKKDSARLRTYNEDNNGQDKFKVNKANHTTDPPDGNSERKQPGRKFIDNKPKNNARDNPGKQRKSEVDKLSKEKQKDDFRSNNNRRENKEDLKDNHREVNKKDFDKPKNNNSGNKTNGERKREVDEPSKEKQKDDSRSNNNRRENKDNHDDGRIKTIQWLWFNRDD